MSIEQNNKIINHNTFKFKTIVFLISAILGTLAAVFSFLGNEGIKIQIFFIIISFVCIYIVFNFFKKRNVWTKEQIHLFWKVAGTVIIFLTAYAFFKNSETPASEKNKSIFNTINNSFDKNNFRDLHIHNHSSQQEYLETVPPSNPSIDGNPLPAGKKAIKSARPIQIEDSPELPIMEVPKDAGEKKIIKPVLPFPT